MQRILTSIALAAIVLASTEAMAGRRVCFEEQLITSVGIGDIEGKYGKDNGNAVYFTTGEGKTMFMHWSYNMSSMRGRAMHEALLFAQTGRLPVTGFTTENQTACDVIDEIHLYP